VSTLAGLIVDDFARTRDNGRGHFVVVLFCYLCSCFYKMKEQNPLLFNYRHSSRRFYVTLLLCECDYFNSKRCKDMFIFLYML
jgi:hypothetical protein